MALLTPPPAAPQRGDRTTFANRVDAFITWLINFVGELVSVVANLNSIAAGGAYSIPYVLAGPGIVGSDAGGRFFLNDYQSLAVHTKDAGGRSVAALLASFTASTSNVKGILKIVAQTDPSRWLVYNVINYVQDSGGRYGYISVAFVNGSDGTNSPLLWGEGVILKFTRNGDKGDKGDPGAATNLISPTIYAVDLKAQGTNGGALTSGAARTLNTVQVNGISGASLSSNRVTVPAGTYNILGRAPANTVQSHRIALYEVGTGAQYIGSSEYGLIANDGVGYTTSRSVVELRNMVLATAKTFELRHFFSGSGLADIAGGKATNLQGLEVYTELIFEKVG